MDVRCYKLITGVELIAEDCGPTGMGYKVHRPLQVHFLRGQDGSEQMAFAHYIMTADQDAVIELYNHVLACPPLQTIPAIEQSYIQNVSGLILPPKVAGQIITG